MTIKRKCSVCGKVFDSEGLVSCPAHSFGDWKDVEEDEEVTNDEEMEGKKE